MKKEIKIGLTIVGGLMLLYLCIAWIKSMHFFAANRIMVNIRFTDLAGLKEGDPVAIFGYPCGNVETISLQGDGARVLVSIAKDVELKSDATADIRVKELMGSKQVWIVPGTAAQPLGDKVIEGTTSLDFASAMAKAGEFMDRFDLEQIDSLMQNIDKAASAFARMSDDMDSLNTRSLLNDVTGAASSMNRMMAEVERRKLIETLDNSLGKVDKLADQAGKTMTNVDALTEHLQEKTLPNADEMLAKVNKMLGDTEGMVVDLRDLLKQLQNPNTVAGKLLYDPAMYGQIDKTLDNLNVTLDHIRTKKIFVTMTLSKNQRVFSEEPTIIEGEKVKEQ